MQKITVLFGPTASGKSARALALAERGVIINADSQQLYADVQILSARPSAEEEAKAPHRLYSVLKGTQTPSAAWWLEQAKSEIAIAWSQDRRPIVVGGTGLYIKTLMQGIHYIPAIPDEIRMPIRARAAEDIASLYAELSARDPEMAAQLKPADTQRITRALEVLEATGKSLLHWQAQPVVPPYPEGYFEVETCDLPREELYARIDARVLAMMESGALEEVRHLMQLYPTGLEPIWNIIGTTELRAHLLGETSLETAIAQTQQFTRNYAKRQQTWLRNQL